MYIASLARWNTQLKGMVELERRCQGVMQEVQLISERQEVLVDTVVSKRDMQKEVPKKYQEKEGLQGIQGARGAKAYADKVGRRKGKSENVAKIGRMFVELCALSRACDREEVGSARKIAGGVVDCSDIMERKRDVEGGTRG